MTKDTCYYRDDEYCTSDLWECQTCHELYCEVHGHYTSKGTNIECVACEQEQVDYGKE